MLDKRESGILLHPTSLPSEFGIGDLGPGAYRFADFLAAGGQHLWQMLPLTPTEPAFGNSPYNSPSAHAANPLLISPELLRQQGLLEPREMETLPAFSRDQVEYETVALYKNRLFEAAFERFNRAEDRTAFDQFCLENTHWLEDYALYIGLREHFQKRSWSEWPPALRDLEAGALKTAREKLRSRVELAKFLQYVFDKQWTELKNYCAARNIRILGDLPVYVNYDSADVWTHVELFNLDAEKKPLTIAGVPPDYFSETGQLWGNPVYRWPAMKQSGYAWWISRLKENFRRFDFIRIDHLRGFVGYWEVPAGETTSVRGRWVPGPGDDFFKTVLRHFPAERFVAEDLGTITDDVRELIKRFNLPGMKVLLFAFGPELPHSPYAPHNHVQDCLVYTGTHDNNTIRGWYESELTDEDRERINRYLGRKVGPEEIAREMVRLAMTSVARTAIFPLQDLLGLGQEARMNHPASPIGNWRWRVKSEQLTPELAAELHELTHITGRT